jgi:hypothetical protein
MLSSTNISPIKWCSVSLLSPHITAVAHASESPLHTPGCRPLSLSQGSLWGKNQQQLLAVAFEPCPKEKYSDLTSGPELFKATGICLFRTVRIKFLFVGNLVYGISLHLNRLYLHKPHCPELYDIMKLDLHPKLQFLFIPSLYLCPHINHML